MTEVDSSRKYKRKLSSQLELFEMKPNKEAEAFYKIIQKDIRNEYFSEESNLVHLISMTWYVKWARFSGYISFFKQNK